MCAALTVGDLVDKLNFAVQHGYITRDHKVIMCGGGDTRIVENICLPSIVLDETVDFKIASICFTDN